MPKVLIACPTWKGGEYALKRWAEAFRAQDYPGERIGAFMVDNTEEDLHYCHMVRGQGVPCRWLWRRMPYLWDTLELCWVGPGGIVEYAHENGYDFIFSVEHDVIVPPEATRLMVETALANAAEDGKPAVVSHRYHPRGQFEFDDFVWDTLGATLLPVEPLWQERLLAKASYEIEVFIVCKRQGHPRVRAKDLFVIEHLKDPEDKRVDECAATPAYDMYAQRKIDYNARIAAGVQEPERAAEEPEAPTEAAAEPEPEPHVKRIVPGPAHLVGGHGGPEPAELAHHHVARSSEDVKMKSSVPEACADAAVNLGDVSDKETLIHLLNQPDRIRLNLGCGYQQIAGFVGVDFDPDVDPDVVSPIEDLSWQPTDSVDMIYASHCLEHMEMETSKLALREWLRVLKPGGYLDVAVPDINEVWLLYKKGGKWGDYQQPCDELYINATAFGANLLADVVPEMRDTYGGPGHQHKQIFIHDMLLQRVAEAGYVEAHEVTQCFLRRCAIGERMVQARKLWIPEAPPMPVDPPMTKE